MTTDRHLDYAAGWNAGRSGQPLDSLPKPTDPEALEAWEVGYHDGVRQVYDPTKFLPPDTPQRRYDGGAK